MSEVELLLSRNQCRDADRFAVEHLGLPLLVLMENAGLNVAGAVLDLLREHFMADEDSARVSILCGGGSNGGDGYVAARHLACFGLMPRLYTLVDPATLTGETGLHAAACAALKLRITPVTTAEAVTAAAEEWAMDHVLVDAMLGTGFTAERGPLREPFQLAVTALQRCRGVAGGPQIVAVDVPTGLDVDTGETAPGGGAVLADLTVTFVAKKVGFTATAAQACLGRVVIADIGVPAAALQQAVNPRRC